MPDARPATSTSPRSTAGCSRRATRRWSNSAGFPTRSCATCCCRWRPRSTQQGRRRISYHDLGVEQLGSVYERVLEYEPASRRQHARRSARTSTRRKATGSFYTPRALTEFLVRRTLTPLVEGRSADQILELRIVDPAMGSGAFLVAACRFLAECCEQALIRDGQWLDGDVDAGDARDPPAQRRRAVSVRRRSQPDRGAARAVVVVADDAGRGPAADVSRSPPRVRQQPDRRAARGSVAADRVGSIGQGAAAAAAVRRSDRRGRGRAGAAGATAARAAAVGLARRRQEQGADAGAARRARRRDCKMDRGRGRLVRGAALADGPPPSAGVVSEWIAACDRIGDDPAGCGSCARRSRARARSPPATACFTGSWRFRKSSSMPRRHPSAAGGFDAVIGNPPWDMLRADTGSTSQRSDARSMTAAQLRFCRSSRSYRHQGTGHPNRYQLFLERALQLTRPGGRVGLILPSGIATDHGSASLRRHLFDRTVDRHVARLRQSRADLPDSSQHALRGAVDDQRRLHRDAAVPLRPDRSRSARSRGSHAAPLSIARARLEAWSPEHLTIPEITSAASLGILAAIAERVPALERSAGWHVRFGRELNATDDRPHFVRSGRRATVRPAGRRRQTARAVPGRSRALGIWRFRSRPRRDSRRGGDLRTRPHRLSRRRERDQQADADRRDAAARHVSTHTVFCLKTALDERSQWCLLGLLNSFVANYLVRLQVTTHVTTALMARLPVPRPRDDTSEFDRLVALAKRIAIAACRNATTSTRSSTRSPRRSTRSRPTNTRTSSRRFR